MNTNRHEYGVARGEHAACGPSPGPRPARTNALVQTRLLPSIRPHRPAALTLPAACADGGTPRAL